MSVGHVTHPGHLTLTAVGRKRSVLGRRHSHAQAVSAMAKEHSLSTRHRAVAMVKAGMKQADVAKQLSVSVRSIKIWLSRDRTGESLQSRAGRGRKTVLSRVAKIVLAKAALKRHQSVRKLATKLTAKGHPASKSTVHQYLTKCLHLKSLKLRRQPKLTEVQKRKRLAFAKARKNWTILQWRRVLFSDESPFELFQEPNRQNDRVYAHNSREVPVIETVKQPLKIIVWGMMSYRGLSELHVIPRGKTVTAEYYVESILKETAASAMQRKKEKGSPTTVKLLPKMSEAIFQQDGAPAHSAARTQQWCQSHLPAFWEKGVWPGNSPDLSPIENLWGIMKDELSKMEPATTEDGLVRNLRKVWLSISAETLDNLVCGMPERMRECIRQGGGYIGK